PDIELHPSDKAASFSLVLKGTSDSRTTAYKDPARIYGSSHSEFTARKRLEITANGLRALAAEVKVHETNNEILGADTDVGGLFAGMARNTAMKKARERIPDAEALAARRVRERVASRLNQEVDASVTSINRRLRQGPGAALEQHGLGPASLAAHSTSKELVVEASLLFANQLAAGSPPAALPKGARAVVQIHESAVNNAIDQLGLAGQTIEGAHVRERIAQALAPVFGTSVKLPDDPEQQAPEGSITFAARAPLRVRFVDGQIEVILHAASLQRGNLKTPAQVIRARYQPVLAENRVTLRRQGDVEIRAAEISPEVVSISLQGFAAARDAAIGAALRAPMDRVFRPQINSPKAFTITTELGNVVPLEVTALESRDGWLTLAVR
ncbi:MAG: hypothetical protein HY000_27610, partial [Planctomycetes bacterium]|nr:hypothetical protein [Planctomycetota bacterium]